MAMRSKLVGATMGLAALVLAATGASAATTFQFNSPGITSAVGSGFGSGDSQLNAAFNITNAQNNVSFSLNVGEFYNQSFGVASINETCIAGAGGSSCSSETLNETDNLSLVFTFHMVLPQVASTGQPATIEVFAGLVSDAGADLRLDFQPVLVSFGNGGQYLIDVGDIIFTGSPQNVPMSYLIQLLSESQGVPEPMSLGLLGAGLLGLGFAARRRRS